MCKLLVLDLNIWKYITVCKQIISIGFEYLKTSNCKLMVIVIVTLNHRITYN